MKPPKSSLIAVYSLVVLLVSCGPAWAADLPGAQDHPLIKRFGGSEIVGYDNKRFDEFELQTSTFLKLNTQTNRPEFAQAPLLLTGSHVQLWYEAAGQTSSDELLRNYQNELKSKGFEILYDSTADAKATNWNGFLSSLGKVQIATNRTHYIFSAADKNGIRASSARLKRPQGDVFVYLRAVEWGRDREVYKARRGAYIAVDVIEIRPMAQNMVTVSASEMAEAFESSGRVALYGILFDHNKADLKPESKPALVEIAKLLTEQKGLTLNVVGHTDNAGDLAFNLDLSRRRAEAVVAALVRDYGIAAGRLIPHGVAYLAPVAPNTTDEGRAKNRRVELFPK